MHGKNDIIQNETQTLGSKLMFSADGVASPNRLSKRRGKNKRLERKEKLRKLEVEKKLSKASEVSELGKVRSRLLRNPLPVSDVGGR